MNVRLTWNANTEEDIDHYVVYWGPTPAFGNSQATAGTETTMDLLGLPDRVRIYFAVAAVNDSLDESAKSSASFTVNPPLPVIR